MSGGAVPSAEPRAVPTPFGGEGGNHRRTEGEVWVAGAPAEMCQEKG